MKIRAFSILSSVCIGLNKCGIDAKRIEPFACPPAHSLALHCSFAHLLTPELMKKKFLSMKWTRGFHTHCVPFKYVMQFLPLIHSLLLHLLQLRYFPSGYSSSARTFPSTTDLSLDSALWDKTRSFWDIQSFIFPWTWEWVREQSSKWAQQSAKAKRTQRSKSCEQTSERTSKWPSTTVCILGCSGPQCIMLLTSWIRKKRLFKRMKNGGKEVEGRWTL